MKYSKPDLHLLTPDVAENKCVPGSGATSSIICTSGPDFWYDECGGGSAAKILCELFGTAAFGGCIIGEGHNDACYDGNNAS